MILFVMENTISNEEILKLWRDINFSGSYRGVKTFQILLKTDFNIDISEKRLINALKQDSVYLMHAKPKRNFERRKYDLNYYGELMQCDLGFMFTYNDYKYFIVLIDCFSLKINAVALKSKDSKEVFKAFQLLYDTFKIDITKLETDQGTEFSLIKKFCSLNKIIFKYKFGKNKARFVSYFFHSSYHY